MGQGTSCAIFGKNGQVAVLTDKNELGVAIASQGNTNLWALDNYDADLFNPDICGMTFLSNDNVLVAWTTHAVLAWNIDWKTRTSTRMQDDAFDLITKSIRRIVTEDKALILAVKPATDQIVCVRDGKMYIVTVTDNFESTKIQEHSLSGASALSIVLSDKNVYMRTESDIRRLPLRTKNAEWKVLHTFDSKSDEPQPPTLAYYEKRVIFSQGSNIHVLYEKGNGNVFGGVADVSNIESTITHLQCVDAMLIILENSGKVQLRNTVGLKGFHTQKWRLDLKHVQTPAETQQQLVVDNHKAFLLAKAMEETEAQTVNFPVKENQENNPRRDFLLEFSQSAYSVCGV